MLLLPAWAESLAPHKVVKPWNAKGNGRGEHPRHVGQHTISDIWQIARVLQRYCEDRDLTEPLDSLTERLVVELNLLILELRHIKEARMRERLEREEQALRMMEQRTKIPDLARRSNLMRQIKTLTPEEREMLLKAVQE